MPPSILNFEPIFYHGPEIPMPPRQHHSRANPLVYPPLGRCVYCGSKDQLSTEHIIPRGLGGNIIFPKASCEKCRKITHKFEETCLRKDFLYFRIHTGLHQHPRERPTHLPVRVRGEHGPRLVLPSTHPNWLSLPKLLRPGIMSDMPVGMPYVVLGFHTTHPKNIDFIKSQYPAYFEVGYEFNLDAFAKMLAKIAHCLICAMLHSEGRLSEKSFKPYLPPFIRGENDNLGPFLVGYVDWGNWAEIDTDAYKYLILTIGFRGKMLHVVVIRLFANWRGLDYTVVVGEALGDDKGAPSQNAPSQA